MDPKDALKSTLVVIVDEIGRVLADEHLTRRQKADRIEAVFGQIEAADLRRRRQLATAQISRASGKLAELDSRQGALNLYGVA